MTNHAVPDIVIGRLPKYLKTLQKLSLEGVCTTSSQELSELLGISAAQIRKDLSHFGEFGKQGTGYAIPFLIEQLEHILKVNQIWDMVLIGAGDLGRAVAHYKGFIKQGFRIKMIFDNDPAKIGTIVNNFTVHDIANIESSLKESHIKIAIVIVPASAAQEVAEKLVNAGIQAILNYTPATLNLPKHVHVQNIDPLIQLQRMTYYL